MSIFRNDNDRSASAVNTGETDATRSESSPWAAPEVAGSNSAIASRAAAARGIHRAPREDAGEDLEVDDDVQVIAAAGLSGARGKLPHQAQIQRSFGDHDVTDVEAHTDDAAADASKALGAKGYTQDGVVGFDGQPDVHTAAHEAAHALQDRAGDTSAAADKESHADAVADKVVAGESAAPMLGSTPGAELHDASAGVSSGAVHRKSAGTREVHRKETAATYAWEQSVLKKLQAGKLPGTDAHYVTRAFATLAAGSSSEARRLLHKFQSAAKKTNYFTAKVSEVRSGARVVKEHRTGKDYGGSGVVTQRTCLEGAVVLAEVVPHAADSRLTELRAQCLKIASFYNPVQTYGKHIEQHHGYVRQLTSALDAHALLDHHMLFTLRAPDGVSMWRAGVLEPFTGDPLVGKSKALRQFSSCYGDFIALDARLKAMPNDGWDLTGRGLTKAELQARKKTAAPEYAVAPGDKHQAITGSMAERDFAELEVRANELLAESDPVPGDLYTTMQRLESVRPLVQPKWLGDEKIPPLLTKLQSKFDKSSDPKGTQKDSSQGVAVEIDLESGISIDNLKTALNTIANEPGELGQVSFKISVKASYGNWAIKGFVEGWAKFRLFYGVSDALSCFMGFDASAALGAGISLAGGLVEGKVEAGAGYGMKARFANPDDAATWLWLQLAGIDDKAYEETGGRYKPFDLIGKRKKAPKMTAVKEKKFFVGGEAGVEADVVGGEVGGEKSWTKTTFERDGKETTGKKEESEFTATAFIKVGDFLVNLGYKRTHEVTEGDINETNNEDEMKHQLSLELDLTKTIRHTRAGGVDIPEHLPSKRIFDMITQGLSKFASKLPEGKLPDMIIDKLVEGVGTKIFEVVEFGRKYKLGASVMMDIEFVSSKETGHGGAHHYKYARAGVTPKFKASLEIDAKVIEVKAELELSKREVVFESLGTDNSGYVFQRYVFAWDPAQWKSFVAEHRADIAALISNMAKPKAGAYDAALAAKLKAAGYPKGSFEDHLAVVEKHWDAKRDEMGHEEEKEE